MGGSRVPQISIAFPHLRAESSRGNPNGFLLRPPTDRGVYQRFVIGVA